MLKSIEVHRLMSTTEACICSVLLKVYDTPNVHSIKSITSFKGVGQHSRLEQTYYASIIFLSIIGH